MDNVILNQNIHFNFGFTFDLTTAYSKTDNNRWSGQAKLF